MKRALLLPCFTSKSGISVLCESAHPQRAEILKVLSSNYALAFLETDKFNLYVKHGKVTSTRFPLPPLWNGSNYVSFLLNYLGNVTDL